MGRIGELFLGGLVALVLGAGCTPSYNVKGEELKEAESYPFNGVEETSTGYISTFCEDRCDVIYGITDIISQRKECAESQVRVQLLDYVAKQLFLGFEPTEGNYYSYSKDAGLKLFTGKVSGEKSTKWVTPEPHYAVCVVMEVPRNGVHFEQFRHSN